MLTGKIALVTGGARGVGRAVCLRLAEEGADVAINYLRKGKAAGEVAAAIEKMGRRAVVIKADIAEPLEIERMLEAVREFGGLDILVANAASGVMTPMMDATEKYWNHTLRTNAFSFLSLVQQAAPLLAARAESRIIAVSSPGASRTTSGYGLVGASKAALEALVRFLAVELAPQGIVVNAVSPGLLDTKATRFLPDAEAMLARVDGQTPAGRLVTVEDVADVVSLLCSPRAKMIVGQTVVVDGGYGLLYSPAASAPATEDE